MTDTAQPAPGGPPTTGGLLTIGSLARRTGLSVRTIRFWSDAGILHPVGRSNGGYRLYDGEALGRLQLIRTLRDLGLGLEAVRRVVAAPETLAEVATTHTAALDVQIRLLRHQRAVLSVIAHRSATAEEMTTVHELAGLSAQERQRIVDDFVDAAFAGIPADAPGAHIAGGMRQMPADLPDNPSPDQVDAWVELVQLLRDDSFRARVRTMAVTGANGGTAQDPNTTRLPVPDAEAVARHVQAALDTGTDPESPAAEQVLAQVVPDLPREQRPVLAEQMETFTDERVERYWQLMAILNSWPPQSPMVPRFRWLIAALRAHTDAAPAT